MFFPYISCSERHVLYPRVYITRKIQKMCGNKMKMKKRPLPRAAPCRKILTRESVSSAGFLTLQLPLVSLARPITQSIYARAIYTPLIGLSSCTPGDRPIFAFPRLIKRFQSHMRVSHSHKSVS